MTPPVSPDLVSPDETSQINEAPSELIGTAEPKSTVLITLENEAGKEVIYETTADTQGNWTLDLTSATPYDDLDNDTVEAPIDLSSGEVKVTMTATDAAGNTSNPVVESFTIDTDPPSIPTITSPQDNSFAADHITIEGTGEANTEIKVTITDGNNCEQTGTIYVPEPLSIELAIEIDSVNCFNGMDGNIGVQPGKS